MTEQMEQNKMLDDGTLVVSVSDATAVTRVLVEDSEKNGDLYYTEGDYVPKAWHDKVCEEMAKRHTADRPKGEWIDKGDRYWYCSECGIADTDKWHWCHGCGAEMKGEGNAQR